MAETAPSSDKYSPTTQQLPTQPPSSPPSTSSRPQTPTTPFILCPCTASPLARRRHSHRRNMPNPATAHAEHAAAWQRYVTRHEGYFEEAADEIREMFFERECEKILAAHPGEIVFRDVDYKSASRVSKKDAQLSPGSGAPGMRVGGCERSAVRGSNGVSEDSDDYLSRYYTLADIAPFDLEAQVGLASHPDEMIPGSLAGFWEAFSSVFAGFGRM